jgi:2-keto-4-pentenoate hydratase/2-oxohepta-3-ene-1,7-dioic acid hydratase in catechol pathway
LKCEDITRRDKRREAYTKTFTVFKKLFTDETGAWGPWMQQAIQFTLYAFIENPK